MVFHVRATRGEVQTGTAAYCGTYRIPVVVRLDAQQ